MLELIYDCVVLLTCIAMRTNPCCKYPNGNLTHFATFTCEDFLFVACCNFYV